MIESQANVVSMELGGRTLGVSDITDEELEDTVEAILETMERYSIDVEGIYAVGSFARGEAIEVASDLDVRIVAERPKVYIHDRIQSELWSKSVPSICGYLDIQIVPKHPNSTAAVRLY